MGSYSTAAAGWADTAWLHVHCLPEVGVVNCGGVTDSEAVRHHIVVSTWAGYTSTAAERRRALLPATHTASAWHCCCCC